MGPAARRPRGGECTIANVGVFPWLFHKNQGVDLELYANLMHWYDAIAARPAGTERACRCLPT